MLPDYTPNLTESQKINLNVISMNTALNDMQHTVESHDRILVRGNGEISLQEKVRNLETFVNGTKYWLRFVGGAIILQTIAFGVATIVYFVKLYPILEKISQLP